MINRRYTDEEIIKVNDILDKLDFFNQRAGRELWNEKPVEIQDADIRNREEDIKFLKDLINRIQAENERLKSANDEKSRQWDMLAEKTKQHYADLYNEAKDILKAEAYKEFADKLENEINCRTTLSRQQDKNVIRIMHNLLKEMVGE